MSQRRPLLYVLVVTLALGSVFAFSTISLAVEVSKPSGSGTSSDPYLISNLEEYSWLSQKPSGWSAYYEQTDDIDASRTQYWDDLDDNNDGDRHNDNKDTSSEGSNDGFSPIGTSSTKFTGTYDGQGYTVKSLYIDRKNESGVGLFGTTGRGAKITDLGVVNADVNGGYAVGGVLGENGGIVKNSYTTGSVREKPPQVVL